MRHGNKVNNLGRKSAHRKSMMANMASSLIMHKRINTTIAKAKALRVYIEPLLTKSKVDSTSSRRLVFSYLKDKKAVSTLFRDISGKIADRPGGYTRILKTGNRLGDNADMCFIELVDFNDTYAKGKGVAGKEKAPTTRRSRKKTSPKAEAGASENDSTNEQKAEENKSE